MKKVIIIAVTVFLLIVAVGLVLFLFVFNSDAEPEIVYSEYAIGELYTNIADEGKILKISMVIEYTDKDLLVKFDSNKSKLINNVYEIFRSKTYETLSKPNGQERVREELKEMVIETLDSDSETITDVYFTQFIIQG